MKKIILIFLIVLIRNIIGKDVKTEAEPEKAASDDWNRRYVDKNRDWDDDKKDYRKGEYYDSGYYNNRYYGDRNYKDGKYDDDERNRNGDFDKDGNYLDQNPVMRNLSGNWNDVNLNNFGDIASGDGFELKERYNLRSARRPLDFGNPDVFGRRERPCRIYDMFCIRNYFAKHGKCKIRTGPAPDPAYRAQSPFYFVRANISGVKNDVSVLGLNGRITEFYVDKVTDKLVITINFPNLANIINYATLSFNRPRQEPVVTEGLVAIYFGSVSITTIIPKLDDLQLGKLEFYSYMNNPTPLLYFSPSLIPTDPSALPQTITALSNVNADFQEAFLTSGSYITATYIQYNLCDFGLKVL